jgi:HlyD family secretion protein
MRRTPTRSLRSPRAGLQLWLLSLVGALTVVVAWLGFRPGGWFAGAPEATVRGVEVRRGPLRISVLEKGNLKAAESVSLKSEIEGQTAILWLIPEGSHVEEGQLLCELDVTELTDRKLTEEISVRNAEAAFTKSKQTYDIQVSQNESDIAKSKQTQTFAKQDLEKFDDTKEFDIATKDEAIKEAEEAFTQARNKLEWSQKLTDNGFLTQTELESDTLAFNRADIRQTQARREKNLLESYELPRQRDELVAALEEAQRDLQRVELQAKARLVDFEADMRTNQDKLDLEKEKLAKLEHQIEKSKIVAPRAGMVVYGQQEGGMRGNREPIAEGTQVRERQEVLSIPSAAGMIAQASLHESVLKQVRVGQECIVKIDSIPGREFRGQVDFVAMMPDQQQWWANPNLRVYRTDLRISEMVEGMRPGMSCAVEILVEEIPDTLFVPVQGVFRHQGANVCFVAKPGTYEVRPVEIGRFNDKWVQITSGVEEGEEVLLSPPQGFTLEPGDEAQPSESEAPPDGSMPAGLGNGAAAAMPQPGATPGAGPGSGMNPEGGGERGGNGERSAEGGENGPGRHGRGEMSPEMLEKIKRGEVSPEMLERMKNRRGNKNNGQGGGEQPASESSEKPRERGSEGSGGG